MDSSPQLSPDGTTVYFGSDDKKLYAVNTLNGTKLWEFLTGGRVSLEGASRPTARRIPPRCVLRGSPEHFWGPRMLLIPPRPVWALSSGVFIASTEPRRRNRLRGLR